jgi:hypothetical protein
MATVKARKVFFYQLFLLYPMSIRMHFSRHSKHRLVAVANFSVVKVLITPTKVSLRLSLPGRGLSAPPPPYRTRRNPPEQSLVNRQMQNRLYVVVSEPFLKTAAMGIGFVFQWKKHYFCRGIQDRLFFRGTGSLPLVLREKLFLHLLFILGWSTYFIFSPSLSESAVCQYFKSLICF